MPINTPNINKNRKYNILLIPFFFITQCCLPDYTALYEMGTVWRMAWKSFEQLVARLWYCNIWSLSLMCSRR